jgi:antitoxin ParD1/3/4
MLLAQSAIKSVCGDAMPTRNVVLTDHHERVIQNLVSSGRYQNASEVLRAGLRLIEQEDAKEAAKLAALREAARIGFEAIDRGEYHEFNDAEEYGKFVDAIVEDEIIAAT